ncbi:MAG: phosphoenolpyruvate--protein phosphotransferase, partial [Sedimentisphaerales bacterium]
MDAVSNGNQTREVKGEILSLGFLAGRLCLFESKISVPDHEATYVDDPAAEIERFERQVANVIGELERTCASLRDISFDAEADIVQTHIYLLKDPQFRQGVRRQILDNGLTAQKAADKVLGRIMSTLEESGTWLTERTLDFQDILNRLESELFEQESAFIESLQHISLHPVIVTHELLPSLVLEARRLKECAFVVEKGTTTSHAAILAKSFGFPVVRVDSLVEVGAAAGRDVLVDAIHGCVIFNPSAQQVDKVRDLAHGAPVARPKSSLVNLWINITDPIQVRPEVLLRLEGVGLYRTEVLFMASKGDFPSEDEQYRVYRRLFETCKRTPVTFRTADIGGDKMLPYFSLGPQENPFLGLRAHRIYRFHPEIFITQVRALFKAVQSQTHLRVMYPMIEDIEELRFVQSLLSEAIDSLKSEGAEFRQEFLQGIMIEVPSAAWEIDELLKCVDFASVGTNDLLQYFLAADRNNSNLATDYYAQSPGFLKMLKSLVIAADRQGKPLSLCGEMATNRAFLPLLVGIGFKDISVDVHELDRVDKILSRLARSQCEELADACLHCRTSQEVG